jgi:predicted deacylase
MSLQRLGRNHGAYQGETIDIEAALREALAAAHQQGWELKTLAAMPALTLHTLHRPARRAPAVGAPRRIYLSAGIHGDEPAGPLALVRLLRENPWPDEAELWCCPCLNPTGFPRNSRANAAGFDLNRDYRHLHTPEVRAHVDWLRCLPSLDLTFCLHEDWEAHGFYLYELNPDARPSLAPAMLAAVARVCPLDLSPEIEGRPASGGLINPSLDPDSRPQWPEAFFLIQHKTRLSYTLEAPSDFPLPIRVEALVAAVRAGLEVFGT